MSQNNLVAAIDLGTSKTVVVIADRLPGRAANLIGFYEQESFGMTQGEIIDTTAAGHSVQHALYEAEKIACVLNRVKRVRFSISGEYLRGRRRIGCAAIHHGRVSQEDILSARRDASRYSSEADRLLLDVAPGRFYVDGRLCDRPVGVEGRRIELISWCVDVPTDRLAHLLHIPTNIGMTTDRIIPASVAAAHAVTDEFVRGQGVLVVDIGAGVTDYALYRAGHLVRTGVVALGGNHLTLDLERELQLSHTDAEGVKRTLARAYSDSGDAAETVLFHRGESVIGGKVLRRRKINLIMETRMGTLLKRIRDDLTADLAEGLPPNGVVFTGGGAKLDGLDVFGERILGMRVSLGDFSEEIPHRLAKQEYATVMGLVHLFSREPAEEPVKNATGWLGQLRKWTGV